MLLTAAKRLCLRALCPEVGGLMNHHRDDHGLEKEGANSNNLAGRAAPCPENELAVALFKVAFVVLAASPSLAPARCHFPNFRHPFVERERESGNRESACSFNLKFWGDGWTPGEAEGRIHLACFNVDSTSAFGIPAARLISHHTGRAETNGILKVPEGNLHIGLKWASHWAG